MQANNLRISMLWSLTIQRPLTMLYDCQNDVADNDAYGVPDEHLLTARTISMDCMQYLPCR